MLPAPYVDPQLGALRAQLAEPQGWDQPRQPPPSKTAALPRAGWPAKQDLDYLKVGIELLLLLLGIPWILHKLVTHPGRTSRDAGKHHA